MHRKMEELHAAWVVEA
jgi:hypothetical protein